jgi:ribosomal protein L7/L12
MPGTYSQASLEANFNAMSERLRRIEAQLVLLSEKAGVPYEIPSSGVPADVLELVQGGKKIEAIKRYRELTNASFDEARDVIATL